MPLLDHFHPPLHGPRRWEGFHHSWATYIAAQLNRDELPADYFAESEISLGPQLEIDVATVKYPSAGESKATAQSVWLPPRPKIAAKVDFAHLDGYEIKVYEDLGGAELRGAIELVSPANKDRTGSRRTFAAKCAGYLKHGVGVVVVDVVTARSANLHSELFDMLEVKTRSKPWESSTGLYAVAYRAVTAQIAACRGLAGNAGPAQDLADDAAVVDTRPVRPGSSGGKLYDDLPIAADHGVSYDKTARRENMRCPFPGMDPYIERPAIWAVFHDSLITYIKAALQPLLRPRYVAIIQERLYELKGPILPDVLVCEEMREPLIHIIEPAADNRLVTAIEALSPHNKSAGPGRDSYLKKREEFWNSGTSLVEIDLLRAGELTVRVSADELDKLGRWHYLVAVSRFQPCQQEIYPLVLERPLRKIAVPLGPEDKDILLDLQAVFGRCYDDGPYPEMLPYDAPPRGRMTNEEVAWCRSIVGSAQESSGRNGE